MSKNVYLKDLAEQYELSISNDKKYYIVSNHFEAGFNECHKLLKNKYIKNIEYLRQQILIASEIDKKNLKIIREMKKRIKELERSK